MENRMSNSPAVLAERAKIVLLWLGGSSARSISQQTGASLSTVYRWIHRWQEEGSVETKPYQRRLRKVQWNDKKDLKRRSIFETSLKLAKDERVNVTQIQESHVLPLRSAVSPLPHALLQPENQTENSEKKHPFQLYLYSKLIQQAIPPQLCPQTFIPFFYAGSVN